LKGLGHTVCATVHEQLNDPELRIFCHVRTPPLTNRRHQDRIWPPTHSAVGRQSSNSHLDISGHQPTQHPTL
jgi:hypothetical protein